MRAVLAYDRQVHFVTAYLLKTIPYLADHLGDVCDDAYDVFCGGGGDGVGAQALR